MRALGILYHRKAPLKLKGKFYHTAVRPTMLYGTKCLTLKNQHENKVSVEDEDVALDLWKY